VFATASLKGKSLLLPQTGISSHIHKSIATVIAGKHLDNRTLGRDIYI